MSAAEEAQAKFDSGDYAGAREAALAALGDAGGDVALLRIAGRAGVEVGAEDAAELLRKVTELDPSSVEAWNELGDALAADGLNEQAAEAFSKAVEIEPDNEVALTQLGSAEFAVGRSEEALEHLIKAADHTSGHSTAAINLVEMYRALKQPEKALETAVDVASRSPEDVVAQLDVAELALEVGRLDEAQGAFERAREIDDVPEHEVYALQGLALVAMRRGDTRQALLLAQEALAIDERGLSADLALHLDVATGGSGDVLAGRASTIVMRVPPMQDEVEAALLTALREHRSAHADDARTSGGGG